MKPLNNGIHGKSKNERMGENVRMTLAWLLADRCHAT